MEYDEADGILRFTTPKGRMAIRIAAFFPCSKAKLNKLLKYILQDGHSQEELEEMKRILTAEFEERIRGNEQALKEHAAAYFENKQKSADLNAQLKEGKYPNGLQILKDDRKKLRGAQRFSESAAAAHKERFEAKTRLIRDLKNNLEVIKAVEL